MVAIFNEYPEPNQDYISEISSLQFNNENFECLELTLNGKIEKEQGNRISYHLNRTLPRTTITYSDSKIYALHQLNTPKIADEEEWKCIIEEVIEKSDLGDVYLQIKTIKIAHLSPEIKAELAVRIIQKENLKPSIVSSENKIEISRIAKYWSETVTLEGKEYPGLALTVKTQFSVSGTLEDYYNSKIKEKNVEEIITNLEVKDFDGSSNGKIVGFRGIVGERREELLKKAKTQTSIKALKEAPDSQPIVAVKFGKNKKE